VRRIGLAGRRYSWPFALPRDLGNIEKIKVLSSGALGLQVRGLRNKAAMRVGWIKNGKYERARSAPKLPQRTPLNIQFLSQPSSRRMK